MTDRQANWERGLWERTLDAIPDLIAILDTDHHIIRANKAMAQRLGLTPEQCVGAACFHSVHGTAAPPDFCPHTRLLLDGHEHTQEVHEDRLGGYFIVTCSPVRDAEGRVLGAVHIAHDITQRKQAELALQESENRLRAQAEELRKTQTELARSNRELEQFASIASHDLQEPVRIVAMFLGLLHQRFAPHLPDKAREYVQHAVQACQQMTDLIRDLLEFSRIQRRPMELSTVPMNAVFELAVLNCTMSIQESAALVTREDLPPVRGDQSQLVQLLQNLVANAIKFRRPGVQPEIHVTAAPDPAGWQVRVRDNGIGIDPQHHERIFQIFQRLHTRREYTGSGIGLAICKNVVERHGGRIWVESQPGQGSCFLFTLPPA